MYSEVLSTQEVAIETATLWLCCCSRRSPVKSLWSLYNHVRLITDNYLRWLP